MKMTQSTLESLKFSACSFDTFEKLIASIDENHHQCEAIKEFIKNVSLMKLSEVLECVMKK